MSSGFERDRRIVDALTRRAERPHRSPVEVLIDRIWRFLCSVRAALYEIVFLTLLVLFGTLKGSTIPAQIPRFVPALEPVVARWYAFDVFHSKIFSATLALLGIAIVVCTINRVPGIWSAITDPTVKTTASYFDRSDMAAEMSVSSAPDQAIQGLVSLLRNQRYRVLTERHGSDVHVYADKHRFGRLGTFPFHMALILVVVGGIVGSEYGFREQVFAIPEGSVRDVGHGTGLRVELERFVDTYSEIGAPTSYRSDLVLYDGAREVKRQSISVNHPMNYENATFYQAAFGPAADIRVTDSNNSVIFEDGIEFTYASRANQAAPAAIVELPAQQVRLELIFPNTALDAKPEIADTRLRPGEMYVQARDWNSNERIGEGTVVFQGETAYLAGLGFQFVRERRFTVLQVAYNPGIPILFAAAILLVVGLIITFGLPHRRIRGIVLDASDGSRILLAPMAKRDWSGKKSFLRTLSMIENEIGAVAPYRRDQMDVV